MQLQSQNHASLVAQRQLEAEDLLYRGGVSVGPVKYIIAAF